MLLRDFLNFIHDISKIHKSQETESGHGGGSVLRNGGSELADLGNVMSCPENVLRDMKNLFT